MLFVRDNKGVCDMGVCVGCYHYAIKGILSCVIKGMCIYIWNLVPVSVIRNRSQKCHLHNS